MAEKYAFKMQLKAGMKAEYKKRHDDIWPALVALLKQAGVPTIRSISTRKPTRCSACCGGVTTTAWPTCPAIR